MKTKAAQEAQARYMEKMARINLVLSPEAKAKLQKEADAAGVSLSSYIKRKLEI